MARSLFIYYFFAGLLLLSTSVLGEEDSPATNETTSESQALAAGHSKHGEVFNEGPRQQAYLMPGTGKIKFEVTSENPVVQKFVEQGIGQLHGFWFFEAERSFRQAAMLDPDCAIAYWGMAQANVGNSKRAKGFIAKAKQRRSNASELEALYIDARHDYLNSTAKTKEKNKAYAAALEAIVERFPDLLEARAPFYGKPAGRFYLTGNNRFGRGYQRVDHDPQHSAASPLSVYCCEL